MNFIIYLATCYKLMTSLKFEQTCSCLAAKYIHAQAMVSGWNLTKTSVLKLSFM